MQSRKTKFFLVTFFVVFFLVSCESGSSPSSNANRITLSSSSSKTLLLKFMNLDQLPEVGNLMGSRLKTDLSEDAGGDFTYNASPEYFDYLVANSNFIDNSKQYNLAFKSVTCDSPTFINNFSWWTNDHITFDNLICYNGIIYPYKHYLLFNQSDGRVRHFVIKVEG